MSSGTAGAATEVEAEKVAEINGVCQATAASQKWMTSNWRNVMAVNRLATVAINVRKITGSSTRESVNKNGRLNCMTKNYFKRSPPDGSHLGECPICFLPLSVNIMTKSTKDVGVCVRHGAKTKLCNVDGCANVAKKGGVCIKHGAKIINKKDSSCSEKNLS